MIVKSDTVTDFDIIFDIINDASIAYKGIIPADRWKEPYMSKKELQTQISEGVEFYHYQEEGKIMAVMGIQPKEDVTLIRHAYVRTTARQKGIGGQLLQYFIHKVNTPILIGTWAAASWAIGFYKKYGFSILEAEAKNVLLKKYWSVPERQIETSIVLASPNFKSI